ncbi:sulfotransferase family protein [Novosphingobium album (ex Hu et al. 2023)]|uniref:Sulfotransferase n=1 Tax=Novosphingobium album (ex Hu et al. 2023) TaxID=2930093 RepID=A0ABT0B0M8_9SPHN|nr:sulfotransferase [Novosphingobium album (ex Hu et al. 2023)]MCJ2178570.1 sulfotransferase [Novosphingobium album (ex Hu et al. 2023)]
MGKALDAGTAIARAVEQAGCSDFGADGWQDGLERSLAAFAAMPLTEQARKAIENKIVSDLCMRLHIEQWYGLNPQSAGAGMEGPVFVVGLPRTGTTATVAMLALDPAFRFLRPWEGAAPFPPPVAGEEERDPRLIAAREAARAYDKPHVHLYDPDGPEEDLAFLAGLDMHAYHGAYPMPDDYVAWWMAEDFASTYAFHARVLKMLQSRRPPNRWLLKSPPQLFKLDAIVRQYPNARFIMTHRDPCKVIPSVASLHFMLHSERCLPGSLDKAASGRKLLSFWQEGMRRGLAARREIGEDRFIDVWNEDVARRPMETFERIYAHLGMDLTAEMRDRLAAYNARNAPGAFGQHRYTLEEYGLSECAVRDAFADYLERFAMA